MSAPTTPWSLGMLEKREIVALGTLTSYILLIAALFILIFQSLPWSRFNSSKSSYLFLFLTTCSFAHTWYYMRGVFTTSFADYESRVEVDPTHSFLKRIAVWLADTSLFEEAWAKACTGAVNWWWSEQICTYTAGPWTVFLFIQGQRYKLKHLWAYMLLGQLVAISVGSNLFYLAIILSGWQFRTFKSSSFRAPPVLWTSVLLSLITVANSPYTKTDTFLPNLLLMHVLLVVPLIYGNRGGEYSNWLSVPCRILYIIIYVFILILRIKTTLAAIRATSDSSIIHGFIPFSKSVATVLHSHPAQASLGWDVIWTSVSFVLWTILDHGVTLAPFSSFFVSAGVVAPWLAASQAELDEIQHVIKHE
ncbi:hypothetical protein L218DRAFT_953392 [Marasmius fiardii PR-910]|nr:hypothetical protein L218DRAFT_953392 [Marasmius fiardii PR-910]